MAQAQKALKSASENQAVFVWEGSDKRGARLKGEMRANNMGLVKADLRRQGIKPLKVRKKPKPLFSTSKKKIIPKDIAIFSRQLATMMTAGVPLVQSFDIVGRGHQENRLAMFLHPC